MLKLISWKHSFNRLNEEYEIAKKKKQALDNLFETGRISQSTRDSFNNDLSAAITEIEIQQKDLLAKMQTKTQELMDQIKTLETLLANYEIQHVVGEIDEEIYEREMNLLATGLGTAKHELDTIKEAATQLCPPIEAPTPESPAPPEVIEVVQNEIVEAVPIAPAEVQVAIEPAPQEPVVVVEAVVEQPAAESIESAPIEAPTEAPQPVEETAQEAVQEVQEPLITVEAAVEQPVSESANTTLLETPMEASPPVEETAQEAVQEVQEPVMTVEAIAEQPAAEIANATPIETPTEAAHPHGAPKEAPQEMIVEPLSEQAQPAEETAATEAKAENTENQQS